MRGGIAVLAVLALAASGCKKAPASATEGVRIEKVAERPAPPEGTTWLDCPSDLGCAFLVPDGWYTKTEERQGTVALFITKEPIEPPEMRFTTGSTINVVRGVTDKTGAPPTVYAAAFLEEAAKGAFATPVQTIDAGKLTVLGRDTVLVDPEEEVTLFVRYRLYANDTTGTLTIALYEQPAPPEGGSLGPGAATVDMAIIDDDD